MLLTTHPLCLKCNRNVVICEIFILKKCDFQALPIDASELLPKFTVASRKMYQTSVQASDWSHKPYTNGVIKGTSNPMNGRPPANNNGNCRL